MDQEHHQIRGRTPREEEVAFELLCHRLEDAFGAAVTELFARPAMIALSVDADQTQLALSPLAGDGVLKRVQTV